MPGPRTGPRCPRGGGQAASCQRRSAKRKAVACRGDGPAERAPAPRRKDGPPAWCLRSRVRRSVRPTPRSTAAVGYRCRWSRTARREGEADADGSARAAAWQAVSTDRPEAALHVVGGCRRHWTWKERERPVRAHSWNASDAGHKQRAAAARR
ncbi:hypothetical protein QJS66_08840 [Kocuria rhizophila]|nr:hypothetical protein QJS66_08840 [Kocuria rhizophila]